MKKLMTGFAFVMILLFTSVALPCEHCGHPGKNHPMMLASADSYLMGIIPYNGKYAIVPVVRFGSDFRLRYDNGLANDSRYDTESYRFRLGADFQFDTNLLLNTRVKLESQANTDQDRMVEFDRANIRYNRDIMDLGPLSFVNLVAKAGKMDSPFFRPGDLELMFDDDSSPEGLSLSAEAYYNQYRVFTNLGHFDNQLAGWQSGVQFDLGASEVTLGGGLYDYSDTITTREVFGEVSGISDYPITLSGQYVKNTTNDESWSTGIKLGECVEPWSGEIYGQYYMTKNDPPTIDRDLLMSNDRDVRVGANILVAENTTLGVRYDQSKDDWRVRSDLTFEF